MELQENERPYQAESNLMQLPENIIYLFQTHLDTAARIAFSLSCRALYERYFAGARKARKSASVMEKRRIIVLLEKDVANREFFCPYCRRFRSFGPGWRVGLGACSFETSHNTNPYDHSLASQQDSCSGRWLKINDNRGPQFSFHLGRLVMNRHVFGKDCGLPLSCLEVTDLPVKAQGEGKYAFTWKQTQRARIIHNQLYLRCTHVLDQAEQEGIDAVTLRHGLKELSRYNFCKHQHTGTQDGSFFNPELFKRWLPLGSSRLEDRDQFIAHSGSEFGCPECETDYTTSACWREAPRGKGSWVIRVDAYHQLGFFRHANDRSYRLACSRAPLHSPFPPTSLFGFSVEPFRGATGLIWASWHGSKAPPPLVD
ncbi:hypothetical protein INS49_009034 [Diaporthe citri]|uniref:uncharacterized protein n=1 Tax=Diaporthe citri TaxID=83186 RepID=UPI001C8136C2|nr:uncharacterized protein INS49_009034 [Diaporthe citri]KAG6363931.1 hypothetical protein INS49_009034 [Diaporthe citri]